MDNFANLAFLLAFTCIISLLVNFLRFPLVLGYILVGILIGPYFLNLIPNAESLDLFAKIGIVSLLFIIGLNLNPKTIKEEGGQSLILGLAQIILTTTIGFIILYFGFAFSVLTSLLIASGLTLSSTIIVLKIITDKGDIERLYAKMSLGVLLIQDFFAAILLLLLSIKHTSEIGGIETVSMLKYFGIKILILILIYILLSRWILPRVSQLFAKSQELLLLFSLAFSFLYAYLFEVFGFSLEIGALLAGIILSNLNFARDIASRFRPIRDFFIIIFFILLGFQAEFVNLASTTSLIIVLSIFVIIFHPLILFVIMNLLGHRTRTSFYTGLSMGQVSEFSLVVLAIAKVYGYIDTKAFSIILIIMLISICFSSYFLLYSEKIYKFLKPFLKLLEIRKIKKPVFNPEEKVWDMIIFGYDKVSFNFLELAKKKNYHYLIIDIDPVAVKKAEEDGGRAIIGDAENLTFLEENHILRAKMIISTIPYFDINLNLIKFYKQQINEEVENKFAITLAYQVKQARELYSAGADYVILPYHIGAKEAVERIEQFDFSKEEFQNLKNDLLSKLER